MPQTPTVHPYHREVEFVATLRDRPIRVVSKPGFANWEAVSPAATLLAESVILDPAARILHLGCGHGGLGVFLARAVPEGEVTLVDASQVAVAMAARTLAVNGIVNARVASDPLDPLPAPGSFDAVVVEIPAGRKFARRWLALAHRALRGGGQLYLAGPKDAGISSVIGDAKALFGQAATLAYRAHQRIAVAARLADAPAPDWAAEPGIAPGTWHHFSVDLGGRHFAIESLPGVFSHDRLDDGTAFLLRHLRVRPGERMLDLGCGWGALGLAAAAAGATVDLVDASLPAVASAARNITAAGLDGARALAGDALAAVAGERYDLIVSNPPFHAGKAIDYDASQAFIAGAREHLTPRGRLVIVANAFIRHERAMQERFGEVVTVGEDSRYHVLEATRGAKRDERRDADGR